MRMGKVYLLQVCAALVLLFLQVVEHATVVSAASSTASIALSVPENPRKPFLNYQKRLQVLRPRSLAQSTITYRDIPRVTTALGLKLNDAAAERAFFAKDYSKVSYADFRALWARAEQAKQDEQKLIAAHASTHAIICNKLIKVGTEAIVGVIYRDPPFATEHLLKFRHNLPLAGRTCKDVGI